jgi:hypothetical protein
MSRIKTAYGRIWVCGVVVEETLHEGEVTSSNHGNRGVSRLAAGRVGVWLIGVPLSKKLSICFEPISKIHCAGGRLCHPPTLWFRGGGRATTSKDSYFSWHKTAGECYACQHKGVLAAWTNRFWHSEVLVQFSLYIWSYPVCQLTKALECSKILWKK